jgi:hypothetical protein
VDAAERNRFLDAARGVEASFALTVDGHRVAATWDPERVLPDRASAVIYLKFPLGDRARESGVPAQAYEAFLAGRAKVELSVSHPAYEASVPLPREIVTNLAEDLRE